jgi:CHAT domain-containing protein
LVNSQGSFQDVALSFGLLSEKNEEAVRNAASIVLHFKGLSLEENAYLSHLTREGSDPRVRALAQEIATLHNRLSRAFQAGVTREGLKVLTTQLDRKRLELGEISREFTRALQSRAATLQDVQARLKPEDGLLEVRQYRPVDFITGEAGEPRWAGIFIEGSGTIGMRDLGTVAGSAISVDVLSDKSPDEDKMNSAARELHAQLLAPFAAELAGKQKLYVAPDGILYLVPFGALSDDAGGRLVQSMDVRLLQTARDLVRASSERRPQGLIAMGGIDFGELVKDKSASAGSASTKDDLTGRAADAIGYARAAGAETFRGGFRPLKFSKAEVERIGMLYGLARPDERPPQLMTGADATKASLMSLPQPPRVLHLATHAFFRPSKEPADQPLLLSGIALAHANDTLSETSATGLLYGIEFLDLNLEGTELVVLSACETAQGQIDYGEGVSGLVQAARTAGAEIVIVTLRPVDDEAAADFMELFYHHWLSQENDDPAAAFQKTQLDYISGAAHSSGFSTWSNFIMIGG